MIMITNCWHILQGLQSGQIGKFAECAGISPMSKLLARLYLCRKTIVLLFPFVALRKFRGLNRGWNLKCASEKSAAQGKLSNLAVRCIANTSGSANSEKFKRNRWGWEDFFNLKVYPTNLMPYFFDNFCWLFGFGGNKSPHGAARAATGEHQQAHHLRKPWQSTTASCCQVQGRWIQLHNAFASSLNLTPCPS